MPNRFERHLRVRYPWILSIVRFIVKWRLITIVPIILLSVRSYNQEGKIKRQDIKIERQAKQLDSLKSINMAITTINRSLISEKVADQRSWDILPNPFWKKAKLNGNFYMQYYNKAFQDELLKDADINRYDYIGNKDSRVFPAESAAKFKIGDSIASLSKDPIIKKIEFLGPMGNIFLAEEMKWRVIAGKDTLIYGMINKYLK